MGNHGGNSMSPFAARIGIPGARRPVLEMDGCCDQLKNMMVTMFGIHQHFSQGNMK